MKDSHEERLVLRKLGRRIQSLRQRQGISQEQLAHMIGISRVYQGYIEQGRSSPAVGKLFRMAKALHVPLAEFFRS